MRHYGFRRRTRGSRSPRKASIQHSPSSMGNVVPTNDQLVTFMAVATVTAGTSMTTNRLESDRLVEVANGHLVGQTTWDVGFQVGSETQSGYVEYVIFKAERQPTTPVVGTHPIPTDAEVIASGMQQMYRSNMPGWVLKFGTIPVTSETIVTRQISINWAKFRKGKVRDGDFFGITFFNRTATNLTIDWQCRYKSYG